jgi:hypothetical protein
MTNVILYPAPAAPASDSLTDADDAEEAADADDALSDADEAALPADEAADDALPADEALLPPQAAMERAMIPVQMTAASFFIFIVSFSFRFPLLCLVTIIYSVCLS